MADVPFNPDLDFLSLCQLSEQLGLTAAEYEHEAMVVQGDKSGDRIAYLLRLLALCAKDSQDGN